MVEKFSNFKNVNENLNDIKEHENFIKDMRKTIDMMLDGEIDFVDMTLNIDDNQLDITVGPEQIEAIEMFVKKLIELDEDFDKLKKTKEFNL